VQLLLELDKLDATLKEISCDMKRLCEKKKLSRILHLAKHKGRVRSIKERLDEAVAAFEIACAVRTEASIGLVQVSTGRTEASVDRLEASMGRMELSVRMIQTALGADRQSDSFAPEQFSQPIPLPGLLSKEHQLTPSEGKKTAAVIFFKWLFV